jgi:subfamily B ATP-binding cassette protein MsbA
MKVPMAAPRETPALALTLAKRLVWSERRRLALGLSLLLVDRAAGLVAPLAPKVLLDEVVGGRRVSLLPVLAAAVLVAAAIQALSVFALSRVLGLSSERIVLGWRRRLLSRVSRMPAADVTGVPSGELVTRVMDDPAALSNLVGWDVVRWSSNVVTALVAFVALLWLDWRMTLAALAFAAGPGLGFHLAHRRMRPLFRERSRMRAEVSGRLAQTIAGLRVVKAYGAEKREDLVFARGLHRLHRLVDRTTGRRAAMNALSVLVMGGVVAIIVVLGGRAVLDGRMSLGDFGSYAAFAWMFAAPLLDLPEIASRLAETFADLERVRELDESAQETDGDAATVPLGSVRGDVAFENVSFGYVPERLVLRDVSFRARAGTTTAIVGPSGAGKSTLLSLVLAFHRPTSGRVTIDGRDLATASVRDVRRTIAVVLQDDFLFDGTIAENIAFGSPRKARAEIEAAARAAHCDEFVRGLPRGLDTPVGERGVKLSGGQRQRVTIARAMLADAPILVLDEATSSLDSENENHVREALAELRRGRTVLVVAHRLSTVRDADQILVLDAGAIVERGTHLELLEGPGRYRLLHDAQHGTAAAAAE